MLGLNAAAIDRIVQNFQGANCYGGLPQLLQQTFADFACDIPVAQVEALAEQFGDAPHSREHFRDVEIRARVHCRFSNELLYWR